ncbi:MAG TPA: DUF1015 family protein [Fimbriimonadaceae bacterium]|nr:hypothetical protein [Armatimonadota bacterium]HRD31979.1 DUF1015 family protein [Fimbriimonadaceae bacterium]HRE92654.1 DUF1015 family protein [Fimbriimonadaceae bacterium]HRI73737.1 DUF1015 family protein [Fimbriimonadaceae bacterium]
MVEVRPFRGLSGLPPAGWFPPVETLTPEAVEALRQDPLSAIHLVRPRRESDDRSQFVQYARSAAQLESWRRDGTLALADEPRIFGLKWHGMNVLYGLVAVTDLHPQGAELPTRGDDRLRLLESTDTFLEPLVAVADLPTLNNLEESILCELTDESLSLPGLQVVDSPERLGAVRNFTEENPKATHALVAIVAKAHAQPVPLRLKRYPAPDLQTRCAELGTIFSGPELESMAPHDSLLRVTEADGREWAFRPREASFWATLGEWLGGTGWERMAEHEQGPAALTLESRDPLAPAMAQVLPRIPSGPVFWSRRDR